MTSNIEEIISQYLTMPTNYAVLINGERGRGKTFCIKNKISKLIKKTKVLGDQRIYYKYLYISLYGINSMDEIYSLMMMEIAPILKTKELKVGLSLSKIFLRGLMNVNKAGNLNDYSIDLNDIAKNTIDTKNFVFIFDDIDRKSNSLDINSLIGFVNSLVEHENNKIILIADNEYIKDPNYTQVKEKTIGTFIDFTPDFDTVYDEIIKGYLSRGSNSFHRYLQYYKETINNCFAVKEINNFRILTYLLEHLYLFYGIVYDDLKLHLEPEDNQYNLKKLENAIKFATAVSIEFRLGNISFKTRLDLDSQSEFIRLMNAETVKMMMQEGSRSQDQAEKPVKKEYFDSFLSTYFPKHDYHYYASLYNFFTGGSSLSKEGILAEWKKHYDDHLRVELPQYILYNSLHYLECLNFSNDELRKKTNDMLAYAYKGAYSLDLYLSVYYYVERFNAIFNYDMIKIATKLIAGLEKHKENFGHVSMLSHQFGIERERPLFDQYKQIFDKTIEVNNHQQKKAKFVENENLYQAFIDNPEGFYHTLYNQHSGSAIFNSWDADKLFSHIKRMKARELFAFNAFLTDRGASLRESEKNFFKTLQKKIRGIKPMKNLKGYVYDNFFITLEKLINSPTYH